MMQLVLFRIVIKIKHTYWLRTVIVYPILRVPEVSSHNAQTKKQYFSIGRKSKSGPGVDSRSNQFGVPRSDLYISGTLVQGIPYSKNRQLVSLPGTCYYYYFRKSSCFELILPGIEPLVIGVYVSNFVMKNLQYFFRRWR